MNLSDLAWPRATERLVVRPPVAADLADVFAYRRRPSNSYWTGGIPVAIDAFDAWVDGSAEPANLVIEHDGVIVGDLMVRVEDGWGQKPVRERAARTQAELGWVVASEHQGRGFATEAIHELFAICFDGLGLRRVVAMAFAQNEVSWRLMERVGMRREGLMVQDSLHAELGWLDGVTYALLADEWREQPR